MTALPENCAQLVAEIVVPDLNTTLDFLVGLGFRVDRITEGFAVLRWDEAHLFIAEDQRAVVGSRWLNIRVIVQNVDAMLRKAQLLGGRMVSPIGDRSYGLRDFVVEAPGGVEIRFAQNLVRAQLA